MSLQGSPPQPKKLPEATPRAKVADSLRESERDRGASTDSQQFGKYGVVAHIASGAVGAVYRAIDRTTNQTVALKVLSPELSGNPVLLKRFEREARSAAKLRHPNIVEVYELAEADGIHFIAMEFVDGVDVLRYLRRSGALPVAEALEIVRQTALALDHAHQSGIVHRDIKPSNLILTRQGEKGLVKLADLGLARDLQNADESHLTRMGAAVGTVDYMAPEQAKGSHLADIRSDLYSLGCTLYHMLTGRPPFPQGEFLEKLYKHVHVMPADPRDLAPDLPDGVILLLGKLLQKKPEDRYQTPAELVAEIERLQGENPGNDLPYVLAAVAEDEPPRPPVARYVGLTLPDSRQGDASVEQGVTDRTKRLVLLAAGVLVTFLLILYFLLS